MTNPVQLRSASDLVVQVNRNGSIRRMDLRDVILNMYLGSELEDPPANLYLRHRGARIEWTPLLGPHVPGTIHLDEHGLAVRGEWRGVRFTLSLVLAAVSPAWFWHLALENAGDEAIELDVVYAQDVALSPYGAVRMNEYYVSQYLDLTPLTHPSRGVVVAVRQNLAVGDRHPWAVLGSLGRGVAFATDALDLHGLTTRAGAAPAALPLPALPSRRRQHEHAMVAIQDEGLRLAPGAVAARGFFGWLEVDHPAVTTDADVAFVDRALALPEAAAPGTGPALTAGEAPVATLFSHRPTLRTRDLEAADLTTLFGGERRHVESEDGSLLSFFTGGHRHVVLKPKEEHSLRPHGQIMRTGDGLVPDEASLASTAWMNGVFHSLVTQGHVNINRVLSTTRSYLGLARANGLRIFVELEDGYHLLGVPSAFAMTPGSCEWIYDHGGGRLRVTSHAATACHELALTAEVLAGPPRRFLLSFHVALGGDDGADPVPARVERDERGVVIRTDPATDLGRRFPQGFVRIDPRPGTTIERIAGDEMLFADGRSRALPYVHVVTAPATDVGVTFAAALTTPMPAAVPAATDDRAAENALWTDLSGRATLHPPRDQAEARVTRVQDIVPWFAHDAMIHYLAPRGLEQFSGGGWGTRDVCQGPVEWLLGLGRVEPVRDLLLRVFGNQNPDGDWPQWFMFFARDRGIRAPDSHGDIVFWPLLALGQYLLASDDRGLLDATLPFFHPDGDDRAERKTVLGHVERALAVVDGRQIPGTSLVAYGHGDWNDSLQPADPSLQERLCSAWTVTLQFQTATTLAAALRRCERADLAARLETLAARTRDDFQRLLLPDGTLTGFAHFQDDGRIEYLLHPRDRTTGMHYSLLPMIHAILAGLLTPEQAAAHVGTIRERLLAADGARLFDRPPEYRGGTQRIFQRAETSTFFGREIGLMYVHAHLRYAEAMAHYGDAEAFYHALLQAIPIGLRDVVPNAHLRQANCYTSSSDAAVADRYEAQARYDDVRGGRIPVEGGWRVYSSGAGIGFRLMHERLLGLRRAASTLTIDPVLPRELDGLAVDVDLRGRPLRVVYEIAATTARGCGPVALELNGAALPFDREHNPYRTGGAIVSMAALGARLQPSGNELRIQLG
jgi:cellobiose phosphorylase